MADLSTKKYRQLQALLREMPEIIVAFSGGVDSSLLLCAAKETLGEKVTAVTESSPLVPNSEINETRKLAARLKAKHFIIESSPLSNKKLRKNPRNRCYWCKRDLFDKISSIGNDRATIVDGTNHDDLGDFRPGIQAAKESGVRQPLAEVKLTKKEIRTLAHRFGLPNWNKESQACLASRIPYGVEITAKRLKTIEKGESYLRDLGLHQVRLRLHDEECARIEVAKESIPSLLEHSADIVEKLRGLGLTYVTLDLQGYRTGSMNESPYKPGGEDAGKGA